MAGLPRQPPPPPAWAAATAEAARRRRRRAGGGSGGGFLGPGGLASRSVRRGSAAAPESGRHLPAATEAAASFPGGVACFSGGSSSFVWVRSPSRVGWPRPRPDSRYGGGGRRAAAAAALLLIASSPPSQQATPPGPACPSHLQRTLGTDRACALGEQAALRRTQCWRPSPPLQQPLTAPQGRRRALGPNSRGSARPLGPALITPGRRRSPTPSMRAAKPAQAPARRGGAETRGPSRGSLSPGHLLGARSRQTT